MIHRSCRVACWLGLVLLAPSATASGWLEPGDAQFRSDLTTVVDAGRMNVPLLGWPIPRDDVCGVLPTEDPADGVAVSQALARLRTHCEAGDAGFRAYAYGGDVGTLRGFEAEPRSDGVAAVSMAGGGERWSARLAVSAHADPQDDQSVRPDGSYVAGETGNWVWSAGWLDRWWSAGWDGSLIWSNNARPIPGVALDRIRSTPFETKWLSWIGPWRFTAFLGALEHERQDIDDALFMGLRVAARPFEGFEIALHRTAQFCGDGLPCTWSSFADLLVGYDNAGLDVSLEDEPGNQLAGGDIRWSSPIGDAPYAVYIQVVGEDESNFLPEKVGRIVGLELLPTLAGTPVRVYAEYTDIKCSSERPQVVFNCFYNQRLFNVEGYRYRGRVIGHSLDADGRMGTLGAVWTTPSGWGLQAVARYAEINRGGAPDPRHTISPTPLDHYELYGSASRSYSWGTLRVKVSAARQTPAAAGDNRIDLSGFLGFERRFGEAAR